MRVVLAILRANWLSAASYRLGMVFSIVSLLLGIIPLFFVSRALQPVMAGSIRAEGGEYFGFLLIGIIAFGFVTESLGSLPGAVGGTINSGTLDTLLGTPSSPVAIFAGMTAYGYVWALARTILVLIFGSILGAQLAWTKLFVGLFIIGLIVLTYAGIGLLSAAMIVAFRTDGPLRSGIITISTLLGGVYYPTSVIPSWLKSISAFVPLTYGLRALRNTVLDGEPLSAVVGDLAVLAGFIVVFAVVGIVALRAAFQYARRAGTVAQY